jgi:osmotically-inducible protein OsmY
LPSVQGRSPSPVQASPAAARARRNSRRSIATPKDRQLSLAEYLSAREDIDKRAQSDAVLTARVKAALIAERGIPWTGISVETYEGGVQLSGFVPAPDMVSRAGRITAGVNGVRTVHNNLTVKQR